MGEKTARYRFFQHRACEYFPCHPGVREEEFNCLFCYCPLYALGEACGGAYRYTEKGVKDCSGCAFPHRRESYDAVLSRFGELAALAGKADPACQRGSSSPEEGGRTPHHDFNDR